MNTNKKLLSAIVLGILFSPPGMAMQEVLNGSYACDGFVDQFQNTGRIILTTQLGATSEITSGLFPSSGSISGLPASSDVLAEICKLHIEQVLAEVPQSCTIGPVSDNSPFPPAIQISFGFSCRAGRNNIMEAISVFSRIPLTASIP